MKVPRGDGGGREAENFPDRGDEPGRLGREIACPGSRRWHAMPGPHGSQTRRAAQVTRSLRVR